MTIAFATELDSVDLRFRFMVIAHFRLRRFRVTAVDKKTGDLLAYETNDRERAKLKLAEFEGRPDLIGAESETQRWV